MSMSRMRLRRDSTISTPSGAGSAPPERPVPLSACDERYAVRVAQAHDGLHFRGGRGKDDRARRRAKVRRARRTRT